MRIKKDRLIFYVQSILNELDWLIMVGVIAGLSSYLVVRRIQEE